MRLPCPTRPILPQALLLISVGLLPGCFLFENCNADGDEDCSSLTRPTPTPNQPPTVTITAPAVSAHHSEGQQIAFGASVTDGEDDITVIGARPPSWSSDRDGPLGAGLSLSVSLSAGIHVVTVTYTDTGGLTASAGQQVNVMPASYAGVNHSPVTTITLPEPSPIYLPGTPIVFEGDAVDPEEGPLPDASLVWEIGSEGAPRTVIGTGRRPTISTPPAGCYAVYLSATDSYGGTGEASRFGREAMFVGPFAPCQVQPPSLTPSALRVHVGEPGTVAVALSGPGRFRAKVRLEDGVDAVEDVLADHSYRLLTAEDWLLTIEPAATLLPGSTHELEIAAYYPQADGAFECRIPLLIVIDDGESNQAPLVSILSPGDRWFYPGEIITFEATAVDPEDGPLSGPSLVWEDSNLGVIGTGESFQRSDLPNGGLSLVVTATDSQGDQGRAYATVRISANGAPLVTIVSPGAAQLFTLGETVTFAGSATDSHDGDLSGPSLVWTSSIDGPIGAGQSFTRDDLSPGIHDVTLTATDSKGRSNSATVPITITAPTTGTIAGAVSVASGPGLPTPLEGVTVVVVGPVTQTAASNAFGQFFFFNMPPGTYTVSISGYPTSVTFPFTTTTVTVVPGQEAIAVFLGHNAGG